MSEIMTVSGKTLGYYNGSYEAIDIEDIATGLSNICRFAGQVEQFYSDAEHSVNVALEVYSKTSNARAAMQALFHDASEAYMNDCPAPLKNCIGNQFREIETRIQNLVMDVLHIDRYSLSPEIKEADRRWAVTEKNILQPESPKWGGDWMHVRPYPVNELACLSPSEARAEFLIAYRYYKSLIEHPSTEAKKIEALPVNQEPQGLPDPEVLHVGEVETAPAPEHSEVAELAEKVSDKPKTKKK